MAVIIKFGISRSGVVNYCWNYFVWKVMKVFCFYLMMEIVVESSSVTEIPFVLPFLSHLAFRPCELLSSLFVRRLVRRPSVNISHFNLLLRNHWANCNQTLVEWSLGGPLPNVCPVIPTFNQDGRQAKNRKKKGDEILIVHCCFSVSQNELKF